MLQSVYTPRIEETAHSAGSTRLGGWFRSWTEERRRRKLRRDAFATLLRVDGDVLEDVTGLRRDQVEAAARLPLDVDALERLQVMRRTELNRARSPRP